MYIGAEIGHCIDIFLFLSKVSGIQRSRLFLYPLCFTVRRVVLVYAFIVKFGLFKLVLPSYQLE